MYVEVEATGVRLVEADVLTALAVRVRASAGDVSIGRFGALDESGTHAWLDPTVLRHEASLSIPEADRQAWFGRFDGMIAYATSKGWMSPDGSAVRAHIERY